MTLNQRLCELLQEIGGNPSRQRDTSAMHLTAHSAKSEVTAVLQRGTSLMTPGEIVIRMVAHSGIAQIGKKNCH